MCMAEMPMVSRRRTQLPPLVVVVKYETAWADCGENVIER